MGKPVVIGGTAPFPVRTDPEVYGEQIAELNPGGAKAEYAQGYESYEIIRRGLFTGAKYAFRDTLLAFYQHFVQKKRVLDLGCGDGYYKREAIPYRYLA